MKRKTGDMLAQLWRVSKKLKTWFPADVDGELAKLAECVMDLVLVRRTESCLHSPRTPSSTFVGCTELFSAHRVSSSGAAAPDRKAEDWVCEHGRAGCNS